MLVPDQGARNTPKQDNPSTPLNQQTFYNSPPPYGHAVYTQSIPPQPWYQPRHVRESTANRFLKALGFALLFWVGLSMFFGSLLNLWSGSSEWPWPYPSPSPPSSPGSPLPPGTHLGECHTWDWGHHNSHDTTNSFPYVASTSFDLPIDAAALFITSAGWSAGGQLKLQASPDVKDAHIDVEIRYYRTEARDRASACLLKRGDNEHGVGVIVDEDWRPRRREDRVYFIITATLPESATVHSFETDLANFAQHVEDLSTVVSFEKINLKSSNSPINVAGVTANEGIFRSSNGPIQGEFYTDQRLDLHTSNSPIKANVFLTNDVELNRNTTLDLKSTNGKIAVAASLLTKDQKEGGNFVVSSATSNSPIDLYFPDAPIKSTLHTSASSSNGPVTVATHPTYQGTFELSSTNLSPSVNVRGNRRNDPAGKDRTRTVNMRTISRSKFIVGETYWSRDESTGSVVIRSSNSRVGLVIG